MSRHKTASLQAPSFVQRPPVNGKTGLARLVGSLP